MTGGDRNTDGTGGCRVSVARATAAFVVVVVLGVIAAAGAFRPEPAAVAGGVLAVALGTWLATAHWRPDPIELWGAIALIWFVVAASVTAVYPLGAKETLGWWVTTLLVLAATRSIGQRVRVLGPPMLLAGGVLAVTAIVEAGILGMPRAGGLMENPNVTAGLLLPLVVSTVARPSDRRWVGWLCCALFVVGIVATGSRAALLALPVGLVLRKPRYAVRWLAPLVLVVLLGLVWRAVGVSDPLAWHRLDIWRAVVQVVAEHPLVGAGPGGLPDVVERYAPPAPTEVARYPKKIGNAESTVLGWIAAGGVPAGLWLVVGVVAVVTRRGWQRLSADARAVIAVMGVYALFHDLLGVPVVLWWWAAVAGMTLPRQLRGDGLPTYPERKIAVGVVTVAVVLWSVVQPAVARSYLRESEGTGIRCDRCCVDPWLEAAPSRRASELLAASQRWSLVDAGSALAAAEHALRLRPQSSRLWLIAANVAHREIQDLGATPAVVRRARHAYGRAVDSNPTSPWTLYGWATLERTLGEVEAARGLCWRAVSAEPNFVSGWLLLARLELDLGRTEAAREAWTRARQVPSPRRHVGRYERSLLQAPKWQVDQLARELSP